MVFADDQPAVQMGLTGGRARGGGPWGWAGGVYGRSAGGAKWCHFFIGLGRRVLLLITDTYLWDH